MTTAQHNEAAWLVAAKAKPLEIRPAEFPTPNDNEIVIRNRAVAINPADWLIQELAPFPLHYPTIIGEDVAGEVLAVGASVTRFRVGDRILASAKSFTSGAESPRESGFQLYTVLREKFCAPIPDWMTFEAASVIPLGFATAATGLYASDQLALPLPTLSPKPAGEVILIWGGSSSVGCNGIQLAKASGYEVFATASRNNFDYLKKLGASQVFDYHDADVVDQIAEALKGKTITGVLDCIGNAQVVETCAEVLRRSEGRKLISWVFRGVPEELAGGVRVKFIFGLLKEDHVAKGVFEDFLPQALLEKKYVPAPEPVVVGHGLGAIQDAMEAQKKVSAQKIVVTL